MGMATTPSSLPTPISDPPPPSNPKTLCNSFYTSALLRRNLAFRGNGFQHLRLRNDGRSLWGARVIRNSAQTDAFNERSNLFDVPSLSSSEVVERLKANMLNKTGKQQYLAMYSSVFGGITTDPALMVIPMDDHMVHRGHGVFDTAAIMDGLKMRRIIHGSGLASRLICLTKCLYELDQHMDRFLRSAYMAKINLPVDREHIRTALIRTVSVSKCKQGSLRYWLSAGPGDFQLSPSSLHQSALYAIVIQDLTPLDRKGVKVVTSTIPIKPPQFATMKNVNYLPNVLSTMEAEEKGRFAAIWLDSEGFIAEGPNMNVAFVTKENVLLMPGFDRILGGCTAKRILALAERWVKEGLIAGIRVGNVTVVEGKRVKEMMLIGSGVLVRPVLQWDDQVIGDGREGPVAQALLDYILEDMKSGPASVRVPVPY